MFCFRKKIFKYVACFLLVLYLILILKYFNVFPMNRQELSKKLQLKNFYLNQSNELIDSNQIKNSQIIFIGGFGRSGTTLLRAILDVHPEIRCGPETKIIPSLLGFLTKYLSSKGTLKDLEEGGVSMELVDESIGAFIYNIIEGRKNSRNKRLCVKDPDVLHYIKYLHKIFPNAKFVHVIRDGRAAAYSYMLRVKEQITFNKFRIYLSSWNSYNRFINLQCTKLGDKFCFQIKYEDLIMKTEKTLKNLMKFLNEKWTDELLKHEKHFNDEIQVSKLEWSTDQIRRPIHNESLAPIWLEKINNYNARHVSIIAPMLAYFGYEARKNGIRDSSYRENVFYHKNKNDIEIGEKLIHDNIEKMFQHRNNFTFETTH